MTVRLLVLGLLLFQYASHEAIHPAAQTQQGYTQAQLTSPIAPKHGNGPALQNDSQPECSPQTPCIVKVVESPKRTAFDYILFAVSLMLGGIGIAGIWVGICTLLNIERQTIATEKAVVATEVNIRAFVNSERPWIQVTAEARPNYPRWIDIKAKNRGRTPAAILSMSKNFCTIDLLGDLPDNPLFEKPHIYLTPQIVLPNDSFTLYTIMWDEHAFGFSRSSEEWEKVNNMDREAYIFGNVIYQDVLNPPKDQRMETKWCFQVHTWGPSREEWLLQEKDDSRYRSHT